MEKTYNPALIQRTQRYMETHSISQNQFAAKVNLSSAALSSYLNQKYKGSVEAVERQLSEFFKLDEEAEAAAEKTASLLPRAAYVPTSISEDVCQSIRFAQLEHCMVVLHGDAGVGKSKGAQKFLHDHPTNAVGMLEKVNRHDRRVTVRVPVGGEDKTITLSYRLNGRQETASNAAAGTPRSVNTADIF